jgi:hypothetical protein
VKEPENVCRSEYYFETGITNKVDELGSHLTSISPFVEIRTSHDLLDFGKVAITEKERFLSLKMYFNNMT